MIGVPPVTLAELVVLHGGELVHGAQGVVRGIAPIREAEAGELAPLLHPRHVADARAAVARGAILLADSALAKDLPAWRHPFAGWAMAEILASASPVSETVVGEGCRIARSAIVLPGVRIGARVTIDHGAVVGAPGFGFTQGPHGAVRAIPHHGGVVIQDDVHVGALATIAAGTLAPTILRRGVKLDAQVHVGHNVDIGEGTMIAAQSGIAGSTTIGRGVLVGGQAGIADHLVVGDGARIAAKSGVIGDVPPGATYAGYPAVRRARWLRGVAEMYRIARGEEAAS